MEVFLFLNGDVVESIHHAPHDENYGIVGKIPNLESQGIFFSGEIPELEAKFGQSGRRIYDPTTSTIRCEYIDRELTPEEKIIKLESELALSKEDNVANMLAITEVYEMLLAQGGTA